MCVLYCAYIQLFCHVWLSKLLRTIKINSKGTVLGEGVGEVEEAVGGLGVWLVVHRSLLSAKLAVMIFVRGTGESPCPSD